MTDPTLRELRELASRATPGPWKYGDGQPDIDPMTGNAVWLMREPGGFATHIAQFGEGPDAVADAALIVWLRNNADALLDAAEASERLRGALERVEWYQPMFNGRPSCPWCRNFNDEGHNVNCRRQRALATPPPATFWLIERGQPENHVPTVWLRFDREGSPEWTTTANDAQRFATREEAAQVIRDRSLGTTHPFIGRATEHSWMGATPPPATVDER